MKNQRTDAQEVEARSMEAGAGIELGTIGAANMDPPGDLDAEVRRRSLDGVRRALGGLAVRCQRHVLQTVLDESQPVIEAADELLNMEAEIKAVVKHLPAGTRAIVGILESLVALDGETVGVDFGPGLLDSLRRDGPTIRAVCGDLCTDPDMGVLCRAYKLAARILDAEDPEGDEAPEAPATPEAEAPAPGSAADRLLTLDKARGELRPVARWLLDRSRPEKLMAVLSHELLKHETEIRQQGLYGGDIGNDLLWDIEADMQAAANPPAVQGNEAAALAFVRMLLEQDREEARHDEDR
jgi:hypothetical protein